MWSSCSVSSASCSPCCLSFVCFHLPSTPRPHIMSTTFSSLVVSSHRQYWNCFPTVARFVFFLSLSSFSFFLYSVYVSYFRVFCYSFFIPAVIVFFSFLACSFALFVSFVTFITSLFFNFFRSHSLFFLSLFLSFFLLSFLACFCVVLFTYFLRYLSLLIISLFICYVIYIFLSLSVLSFCILMSPSLHETVHKALARGAQCLLFPAIELYRSASLPWQMHCLLNIYSVSRSHC